VDGGTLTVWREDGGHGAHWSLGQRSLDDAEAWLPDEHKLLIPYLRARVAAWRLEDAPEDDPHAELRERLLRAEAEVAAVRDALGAGV
jgi:hypothetical protein